jgi:parvulin-like peptidyl-prolyl cis-trans isomerase-like protein
MIRQLLREPLLHFALLGAAIFGTYRLVAPTASDTSEIVITADRIASITAQFSASHGGRPPHEEELRAAVDAYVRDEMLYREGLALGLDRDDPVVRNRIRQKADLLSEDALTSEPSDRDLEAYLAAHQAEFDLPAAVSFQQIYIDPGRHRDDDLPMVVAGVRQGLTLGRPPGTLGDRTLLPATMTQVLPHEVEAAFGNDFARQLAAIDAEGWQGPLTTSYGLHLVRITHRGKPTRATLADARDVVAREWSRAQTAKLKEQFYRMLAERYTVRVEADANVVRTARK